MGEAFGLIIVRPLGLILLAIFFMLQGFAAEAREKRPRKIHQQPRNTVKSGRKAG